MGKLVEEAESGDAVLVFVAAAASTPIPPDVAAEEADSDSEGGGTLRAGGSGGGEGAGAAEAEEAEDGTVSAGEEMAIWRRGGLPEVAPSGTRSRPLSLASSSTPKHGELRCHAALLAARSPFFAALLARQHPGAAPFHFHLDESILPRIYAPVLLTALYTDTVDLSKVPHSALSIRWPGSHLVRWQVIRNCPIPINSLSEVQAIAAGKCQVQPIDEATEIYHIAQFLEFPALAHGIPHPLSLFFFLGSLGWELDGDWRLRDDDRGARERGQRGGRLQLGLRAPRISLRQAPLRPLPRQRVRPARKHAPPFRPGGAPPLRNPVLRFRSGFALLTLVPIHCALRCFLRQVSWRS